MSKYGDEFYGLALYGADTLVDFDASPFLAYSRDYGQIFLQWVTPSGDWDRLRLVRNGFGFPMTPDDGDLLLDEPTGTTEIDYLDIGQVPNNSGLIQGRTYYYTIFVRDDVSQRWYAAGNTLGVSVKDYGTATLMYDYLPNIYKLNNPYSAFDNASEVNADLFNFIRVFAFEHDLFKTLTENARNRYNPLTLDGRLIPLMLNQFGFSFEKEIGVQQSRSLLKNALKIYSELGSASGIKTFVTAFTGFNCEIGPVINLMLDYNNASFKEATGFWESVTNATITRGTASSESPLVDPYTEPSSPSNFPNSAVGFMKLTAAAAGNMQVACGKVAPITRGIPVVPGTSYTLTAYTRAKTDTRTVAITMSWYDRFGSLISTETEATYVNAIASWTRSTSKTAAAPANARYAVPVLTVRSAASGEVHYVDAVQFEAGTASTTFTDARRIDIILRANRINQALNPSFEASLADWSVVGATTARVADGAVTGSDYSLRMTSTSTSNMTASSTYKVEVQSGDQNAFSAYLKGTAGCTGRLRVVWYDNTNTAIATPTTTAYAPLTLTAWQRIELTALAPANAVSAELKIDVTATAIGNVAHVDAILFEKAAFVVPYFDGGTGYQELGDTLWEGGAVDLGRSHYYKNREVITKRLISVLGNFVPTGAPWAVFVAQAD
jgi:hypothetical protein